MVTTAASGVSRWLYLVVLGILAFGCLAGAAVASEPEGTPPEIEEESVSGVTTENAVLEAKIVPGELGGEFEGTGGAWYQFQIATDPAEFWPEVTCPEQPPESPILCMGPWGVVGGPPPQASITRRPGDLPTRKLSASLESQAVALDLASAGVTLQPGTTYHYRVLAVEDTAGTDQIVWRTPPVYGDDLTFTTESVVVEPPPLLVAPPAVPAVPGPQTKVNRQRCQHRKKAGGRRQGIECRRIALRPRKR